jgi:hypothetical protein
MIAVKSYCFLEIDSIYSKHRVEYGTTVYDYASFTSHSMLRMLETSVFKGDYSIIWMIYHPESVTEESKIIFGTSGAYEVDFFNWPNPSSRTMALVSTQPLTDMSTRNLPGGKGRPARKADNLTAICEPIV